MAPPPPTDSTPSPDLTESSESLADLETLLEGLRAGRPESWDECLQRFGRLVYGVAQAAGVDRETAEDVFQETWLTLHGQVKVVRHPAALPGWISTTARRLAWRAARRHRQRAEREDVVRRERSPEDAADPGDLLQRHADMEDRHAVWQALDGLSERCRTLLVALHLSPDSTSYADVALELGMPVGSVGPTRARCLEKLARALESRFGEHVP